MAKHRKSSKRKGDTREIIRLDDYIDRGTSAHLEYEDEEERQDEELKKARVPKAVYRVAVILLALVLVLIVYLNREWLSPGNILNWARVQLMGSGEGEGFPVAITGTQVSALNFTASGDNVLILSNTALTQLDPSGKELLSLSHGLAQPVLRSASGRTLLYNQGGTGYLVLSGTQTELDEESGGDILAGAVAPSGRYALGIRSEDGASELNVFLEDGSLQYRYVFSQDYITAVALDRSGTHGLVCSVHSAGGDIVSRMTVLDFSSEEPVAAFEAAGDLLFDACWTEGGELYAVGDAALFTAREGNFEFSEFNYGGRNLTAYGFAQGRAFVSVSPYAHGGSSTLMAFNGGGEPVQMEFAQRISALSVSGSTVGVLAGNEVIFSDYTTGTELGRCAAGSDARSVALKNESSAYVLGVSEVRTVAIG